MDALFEITGGDGSTGQTGEEIKDGLNGNFDAIAAEFEKRRTVTGIDAITQDDANSFIRFNSATPFDFTLDELTAGTTVSFYNTGAGAVTFTNGAGVTVAGATTLPGATGTLYPTAVVTYETGTTPRVIGAGSTGGGGGTGDVVGPASATNNVPVLFDGTTGKLIKDSTPTGTGNPVLDTSPTLVTPALGTPSALVLTNATDLPLGGIVDSSAASKLLGRGSESGGGDWQEITIGANLTMTGTTLSATGGGGGGSGDVVGPASSANNDLAVFDGTTGKLLKVGSASDVLTWLKVTPIEVAVTRGTPTASTCTLDCNSDYTRSFYTTAAISANTAFTKTNKTNVRYLDYSFLITGTVVITLDSDDRMPDDTPGWNYAAKTVTITSGGTGLAYTMSWKLLPSSSVYQCTISTKTTV